MVMTNWEYVNGAYRNRVVGNKLLQLARGLMYIAQFTNSFTKLPVGCVLPLSEIGTPFRSKDNLAERLNNYNPNDILQKELWHCLKFEIERAAALAFQKPYPAIWRMPGDLTYNLTRRAAYYLESFGNKLPFVGLADYRQLRHLRESHGWEPWFQYIRKGDFVYHGEVGMAGSIRWVEIPYIHSFRWKPVIFADKAVVRVEAETPCLWANNDFSIVTVKGLLAFANSYQISREIKTIKLG